jgi:hypothetical protein
MTAPVINGIVQNMRPDDFGLTATTVLGCARKWRLKIEYPYALEPSSAYWLFRGQVFHDLVERYTHVTSDNGALVEQRLSFLVEPSTLPEATNEHVQLSGDSVVLSGKPDVAFLHEGHLVDYKSTKKVHDRYYVYVCPNTGEILWEGRWRRRRDYAFKDCACGERHRPRDVESVHPPRAYLSHIRQLSTYALMLAENGVSIETAEIVYLDMMRTLRVPVELIPTAEIKELLGERLPAFLQEQLPEPIDSWECKYCPVKDHCDALAEGEPVPVIEPLEKVQRNEPDKADRILRELGYGVPA